MAHRSPRAGAAPLAREPAPHHTQPDTPPGTRRDRVAWLLANQLAAAGRAAGLQTFQGRHLRLPSGSLTPGTTVGRFPRTGRPPEIVLVADVAPAPATTAHYAAAGFDWRPVADLATPGAVTLHLLRREGDTYVRHTTARPGQTLTSQEPFPLTVSTADLD